jgi:sporulation protein YlmC with PRC-barrel domain
LAANKIMAAPVPLQGFITMDTSTTSSSVISSDRVEGTSVYNLSGDKLGSIETLMVDKQSGQVRYAVLSFGGFLGMGTERYPLPWSSLQYDTSQDGYVVNIDKKMLEDAPSYDADDEPAFTDDYGRRVYSHYGTPWN